MISSELLIDCPFNISPHGLMQAQQRVPVDAGHNIPVLLNDRPLTIIEPTLTFLGGRAVSLSLGAPFGFLQCKGAGVAETQQTEDIILTADPAIAGCWEAVVSTPDTLTATDEDIMRKGINMYLYRAAFKLARSGTTRPRP